MQTKEISTSEILKKLYGRDISLQDLSFIKDMRKMPAVLEEMIQLVEGTRVYKDVNFNKYSRNKFDIFYFLCFRLLEIIADILEKGEYLKYKDQLDYIFEQVFQQIFENNVENISDPFEFMILNLESYVLATDFYFAVPIFINKILLEDGFVIDYMNMTMLDIFISCEKFEYIPLPTVMTLNLIKKIRTMTNIDWLLSGYNIDVDQLNILNDKEN